MTKGTRETLEVIALMLLAANIMVWGELLHTWPWDRGVVTPVHYHSQQDVNQWPVRKVSL